MRSSCRDRWVSTANDAQMHQSGHPWSTGNGVGDPGSAKLTLASKLNTLLDERGLSQSEAAQLLGMSQPKVSAIKNYKLRGISLERLMQALLAMGQQVEIVVTPSRQAGGDVIRVAA